MLYNSIAQFKFSAYRFLNHHPSVYLQCKILVCKSIDIDSRCFRGCITRQKRDVYPSEGSTEVLIGPILLKKDLNYYTSAGNTAMYFG